MSEEVTALSTLRIRDFGTKDICRFIAILKDNSSFIGVSHERRYDLYAKIEDFDFNSRYGEYAATIRQIILSLYDYLISPVIYDTFIEHCRRREWEKKLLQDTEDYDFIRWLTSNKLSVSHMMGKVLGYLMFIIDPDSKIPSIRFSQYVVDEINKLFHLCKKPDGYSGSDYENMSIEQKVAVVKRVDELALAAIDHILKE